MRWPLITLFQCTSNIKMHAKAIMDFRGMTFMVYDSFNMLLDVIGPAFLPAWFRHVYRPVNRKEFSFCLSFDVYMSNCKVDTPQQSCLNPELIPT